MSRPSRLRNWDVDLVLWARGVIGRSYVWGETDCGSLARAAVALLYGSDPIEGSSWTDEASAAAALRALGGVSKTMRLLGAVKTDVLHAQSGDLLTTRGSGSHAGRFCIVVAGRLLTSVPDSGVVLAPLAVPPGATLWRLP